MSKKVILFSLLALAVFLASGLVNAASAHGWFGWGANLDPQTVVDRQNSMFQNQAELLGVSLEQVKDYWAAGKSLPEIMEELGLSQEDVQAKMRAAQEERLRAQLQILVSNGVITQNQADQRLQVIQERQVNGGFTHHMGMGFMKGFGYSH